MDALRITKEQARRFLLAYHGLEGKRKLKGKAGILTYLGQVGSIQFDPLNIVGHNQELVLQSRIDGFRAVLLQELLYSDRLLLDGWDKVMCIYSTGDWPYFKRYRAANLERLGNAGQPVVPFLPLIRREIEERGPLSSLDLEFDEAVNWPWGPTRVSRAALESMYFWGELIIHHKVNTRKFYDFASRHLPAELLEAPDPNRTFGEYRKWRICRRIGGVGLLWAKSSEAWLEIPDTKAPERLAGIQELLAEEKLTEIAVEGIKVPLYMRAVDQQVLREVLGRDRMPPPKARILAPLDNLLWDRGLVRELFGFDYRWEVYKPQQERDYGYYVLPVLYGDRFVARFEPGYDKKAKAFVVRNWWWEKGVRTTGAMQKELASCFRLFAGYLGAKSLSAGGSVPDSVTCWLGSPE